ncbi:MAG TPA: phosphoribosyltransferase family protein [Pseudolysinimonas sp.]|nr:phosphoribosyltransferase family protein [Pseudolysinimonas sp.]
MLPDRSRVFGVVRNALRDALALVLPVECAGCGRVDRGLCVDCLAQLRPEVVRRRLSDGVAVFSGLDYSGVAARVILAFKEAHRTDVAGRLAPALTAALVAACDTAEMDTEDAGAAPLLLVPIPGTRAAFRRRGYEPVRVIAGRAGFPLCRAFAPALAHRAQKSAGQSERAVNVQGAFRLRIPVAGRRVVLIDDVVTTGATLVEAARVVREAGGEVVAAATVASTPRRSGPLP